MIISRNLYYRSTCSFLFRNSKTSQVYLDARCFFILTLYSLPLEILASGRRADTSKMKEQNKKTEMATPQTIIVLIVSLIFVALVATVESLT